MKDHVEVRKSFDLWDLPVADAIEMLQDFSSDLKEARLVQHWDREMVVIGWREMTERELMMAERKRKNARFSAQKAKQAKRAREIEELQKLIKRYPEATKELA